MNRRKKRLKNNVFKELLYSVHYKTSAEKGRCCMQPECVFHVHLSRVRNVVEKDMTEKRHKRAKKIEEVFVEKKGSLQDCLRGLLVVKSPTSDSDVLQNVAREREKF